MSCEVASWLPVAVADTLRADARSSAALLTWLGAIRDHAEEYDALVPARPPRIPDPEPAPDDAFDEILSQIGAEIYKLDEYQRSFLDDREEVSLSTSLLEIFDVCLSEMTATASATLANGDMVVEGEVSERAVEVKLNAEPVMKVEVNSEVMNGNGVDGSESESTLSNVSFVTSTPVNQDSGNDNVSVIKIFDRGRIPPVPPPRRFKAPSSASTIYDNVDPNPTVQAANHSDTDSTSTCWSWREGSAGTDERDQYAVVWSHTSGYHRSDEILRKVLSQHYATISRLSFDTVTPWTPAQYSVYALDDRCAPVAAMSPGGLDDGYEPVCDAVAPDENIYEEIEYGCNYTDESCGGSVEVESVSMSASSEGVGRESPLYANLRDNDAYAVRADVIAWKNLLLHPQYNDDEEDEWITPEECAVYSQDQRPPLVIPRITQYRVPRFDRRPPSHTAHSYPEENLPDAPASLKSSVRHFERRPDWSPTSERSRIEIERTLKTNQDSPPFGRITKKFGGSTENLLNNVRRPNHLQLPASSSGDSLDVEIREKESSRNRKSRSMVAPKDRIRSPVPAPRILLPPTVESEVISQGPVKRTKYAENGKKSKKNWTECYMILTHTGLVFYKDQKTYIASRQPRPAGTPPSPTAPRAELVLPLKHAHIVNCIPMHTRRYNRSLYLTIGYDYYLVQDETEERARQWLNLIQTVIYRLGPPLDDTYPHYQSSNTDLESLGRTPPVARHNPRSKHKAGGSSNEDLSDTTEVSIQKSHVRSILRKFFPKRPAMEVLVKKGIYKDEPVFGRNLDEVCPAGGPRVPEFVVACVKEIEKCEENMCTDGLYRASGNLSQVQKIRLEIDQNNISVIENNPDIHVLTGSLKLFFRELKEPLIPCKLFDRILAACSIKPKEAKIKEFRDIVQALPQCNRETLKFLLEHLLRVTKYSERNRMHTANLAIVFGPTLLWAPAEQAHNIAIDCIQQNNVVDTLLTDYKEIFEDSVKGKKKA